VNLKSLRLENCKENCQVLNKLKSHEVFTSIRDHSNLKILELVNINFCDCVNILEECVGLKAILIILAHNNDVSLLLPYLNILIDETNVILSSRFEA